MKLLSLYPNLAFKCQWVNENIGVCQDELGFTLVDLRKVDYKDNPFIMAEQARQVFYIQDPCDLTCSVVLQGRTSGIIHHNDASNLDIGDTHAFSP